MNQQTEQSKKLSQGFILSTEELDRIHGRLCQRITEIDKINLPDIYFKIDFKEYPSKEFSGIDQVKLLHNGGKEKITKLELAVSSNQKKYIVRIVFLDTHEINIDNSIEYQIIGEQEDWVIRTEEEINKRFEVIKKPTFTKFFRSFFQKKPMSAIMMSGLILVFLLRMIFLPTQPNLQYSQQNPVEPINQLESRWRKGEIKDPVEAIILLEKAKLENKALEKKSNIELPKTFNINTKFLTIVILIFFGIVGIIYRFPEYTFYWGDSKTEYDKKQNISSLILVGGGFSLLVAYIYDFIKAQ